MPPQMPVLLLERYKKLMGDKMKIIKPGDYEKLLKPKHFCCTQCGCEFEADVSEYKSAAQIAYMHDGITAVCKCPLCDAAVYAYE